jgi:hypothetical protein
MNQVTNYLVRSVAVEVKHNYGSEVYYPVCEASKVFARLCRTETLTPTALHLISELGYDIDMRYPQPRFTPKRFSANQT